MSEQDHRVTPLINQRTETLLRRVRRIDEIALQDAFSVGRQHGVDEIKNWAKWPQ